MSAEERFRRNLDWNLLKIFQEIVRAGGISKASDQLCRKQPAVSLALRRLEDKIGVRLCERGPSGFALTTEGETVANLCTEIGQLIALMPERVAASGENLRGRVRLRLISSVQTPALDQALQRFHRSYPGVEIEIGIAPWEGIAADLLRGAIDAGVGPVRFRHAELEYDLLFNEIQHIYCGPGHPLWGTQITNLTQLTDERFVLKAPGEPDEIMRFRLRHGLGRNVAAYADHVDEMQRLTLLGVGIAFLPVGTATFDLESGRLWCLTPRRQSPSIPIYVITNRSAPSYRPRELLLKALRGGA